jgi:hypothetical protein
MISDHSVEIPDLLLRDLRVEIDVVIAILSDLWHEPCLIIELKGLRLVLENLLPLGRYLGVLLDLCWGGLVDLR